MSDIASSDLFNIVQVLQSWCFKRNSNRIYSGRKDWPEDSPTTRFTFLLVILVEIAILYARCFFLRRHKRLPWNQRDSHGAFNRGSPVAWPGWRGMKGVAGGASGSRSQRTKVWTGTQPVKRSQRGRVPWCPQISCRTSSARHRVERCSSSPRNVNSRNLCRLVERCMGEKFIQGSARQEQPRSNILVHNANSSGVRSVLFGGQSACVLGGKYWFSSCAFLAQCDYFIHVCMRCFKM